MKALLVLEVWGKGGTEAYVSGLVRFLNKEGVDVYLYILDGSSKESINILPADKILHGGLYNLHLSIKKINPDVINLHLYTTLLPSTVIARIAKVKPIITLHSPLSSWGTRHRLYWKLAIQLSEITIPVANIMFEEINSSKLSSHSISGAVADSFFKNPVSRNVSDSFEIAAIGRHSREKQWDILLCAINLLPDNIKQKVNVNFFGTGKLTENLQDLSNDFNIKSKFHGHLTTEELIKELTKIHLSVLPSSFEGLPIAAIEGMACGIPTVVSNFKSSSEFIKNEISGNIFEIGDAQQLSNLIAWHYTNQEKSMQIGIQGKRYIERNYCENVVYSKYMDIYKSSIE